MDTAEIIAQLEEQLENLNRAIAALKGGKRSNQRSSSKTGPSNGRRRHMSPAARKKISEAAKARWARWKKAKA
jgi:hypothetical protein